MPFVEMQPGRYVASERVWRIDANPDLPDDATSWPIGLYEDSQDSRGAWYWYGTAEARDAVLQRLLGAQPQQQFLPRGPWGIG